MERYISNGNELGKVKQKMPRIKGKGYSQYLRRCIRCKELYISKYKMGKICDSCCKPSAYSGNYSSHIRPFEKRLKELKEDVRKQEKMENVHKTL